MDKGMNFGIDFNHDDRTAKVEFTIRGEKISGEIDEMTLQTLRDTIDDIYYGEDVTTYLEDSEEYDGEAIIENDNQLWCDMCEYYKARRRDHSTGASREDMEHWTESLDKTIEEFEDRLEKYRI